MKKDYVDPLVQAISESCQTGHVKRANAALPQFKPETDVPDQLLVFLERLAEAENTK